MRHFVSAIAVIATLLLLPLTAPAAGLSANEQVLINNIPYLTDAIADGKELRYLGRQAGMDGWIARQDDQIEIFYTTTDGDGVVLGVLFDENGENITRDQMATIDDLQPVDTSNIKPSTDRDTDRSAPQTSDPNSPGERLFNAVKSQDHFSIGSARAPEMYIIVDPTCPFCKTLWANLADPYIKSGQVRVHIIPIGALSEESSDIAARIFGADDSSDAWLKYIANGAEAVADNPMDPRYEEHFADVMAMMEEWQMTTVPYSVYRSADGTVKLVRGVPKDMQGVIDDLRGEE